MLSYLPVPHFRLVNLFLTSAFPSLHQEFVMNRTNTLISSLTGFLVFLLAAAAFLLSFDALKHLAATNGIPTGKAWIYPAIVDGPLSFSA